MIAEKKSEIIQKAQNEIEFYFSRISDRFASDVARLVGEGVFSVELIEQKLTEMGWDRIIVSQLGEFDKVFSYSKQMSKEFGFKFLWTATNEKNFEAFLLAKSKDLIKIQKGKFASDLFNYAISVKLSNKPSKQIIEEVKMKIESEGRRIATEVNTALATFDRMTLDMLYKNADVEKFVYWGPQDEANRETCAKVLADPRQKTGWTREEIDNFEGVDFILGGWPYYNCRHEWIPFKG